MIEVDPVSLARQWPVFRDSLVCAYLVRRAQARIEHLRAVMETAHTEREWRETQGRIAELRMLLAEYRAQARTVEDHAKEFGLSSNIRR